MKGRKGFLWIRVRLNAAVEVSIIEPGEEIYAFAEYWPAGPQTISINEDIEVADINIIKNVYSQEATEEHKCKKYSTPSYCGMKLIKFSFYILEYYKSVCYAL